MTTFETLLQTFMQWRTAVAKQEPGYDPAALAHLAASGYAQQDGTMFDGAWYAQANGLSASPKTAAKAALAHYLKTGAESRLNPTRWFSEADYVEANPDVAYGIANGQWRCGYQHYLLCGMADSRSPSLAFNEIAYLGRNPDILAAVRSHNTVSAFLHYLQFGKAEDRTFAPAVPPPLLNLPIQPVVGRLDSLTTFAEDLYCKLHTDVTQDGTSTRGLRHWINNGVFEDLSGARMRLKGWVEQVYLRRNPDLVPYINRNGQPTGYSHYLMYGAAENRTWAGREWADAETRLLADALTRRSLPLQPEPGQTLPTISVIVPVYNPDCAALLECIDSVRMQTYPHWQLCLADDGSTDQHVAESLIEAARADDRIRIVLSAQNGGISTASNAALALAEGEFVALLDHDDILAPDALLEIAKAFLSAPDVDMVYTDEGKLGEDGVPMELSPKPGWSPDLLLSTMYIGHLTAYRRALVDQVGGFRSAFDGTQDYDLALRMAEVVRTVRHVPVPLYFWRMSPASTAGALGAKPNVLQLQVRALQSALVRRGQPGIVRQGHQPGHWAVVLDPPAGTPLVSIVIPTAGRNAVIGGTEIDLLATCIRSLVESETYPNYEIVVVHNQDLRPATLLLLANYKRIRLVAYEDTLFNLSDKINLGVEKAQGEFVLLLNDDMQAATSDIIGSMMGRMYDGVGMVGARLLYANGMLQHAGVVWTAEGPTHAMIGEHSLSAGPNERLRMTHDVFGVSGACMFFRRETFRQCGGFTPKLPLNYNDVELCLKVREHGYRIVFNPEATLFHFESVSKTGTHFWELQQLILRHGAVSDPYWNPNFSGRSPFYELRLPGTVEELSYRSWLVRRIAQRQAGLTQDRSIKFSFIMSVYENKRYQMEALAATVDNQSYDNWEWVIVDDGSSKPETLEWLAVIQAHPKVRFVRLEKNQGIMAGYGAAFRAATGDYVVPIDADDFLTLDCLHVLASTIEQRDQPDVVYSDEDKGTETGETHSPFLKPDWDPVLFSNICYVCHVCAIKRSTAETVGAYTDRAASWCHDWDTLLRLKRAGARIEHVPEVLYHWRIHQGSTASMETGTKPHTIDSQLHVLRQDLRLTGAETSFEIVQNEMFPHDGIWRLKPLLPALPKYAVIVIGTADGARTATFLEMLAGLPRPGDCLVLLVGDSKPELDRLLPETVTALWPQGDGPGLVTLAQAAARCTAENRMAAVVQADVLSLNRNWLAEGIGMFAATENVAAVGGQVIDTAGKVLWRGGFGGFGGMVGTVELGGPTGDSGYYGTAWCQRLCDGVPSVCFMVETGLLAAAVDRLNGASAPRLLAGQVAMLVREGGKRVVYTPFLTATIGRSVPVGPIPPEGAGPLFANGSAFYSPAFSRTVSTAFKLA